MLTICFFGVWLANILLCIRKKNVKVIVIISIAFLLLLYCGNTLNRDYIGYKEMYDIGDLSLHNIGYQFIGNLSKQIGLSYNGFVSLLVIPSYIIVFYTIYKFKSNFHMFFSLYFAFLVFYDITQVRNFVASCILTLAMLFLFEKKKLYFVITIVIASLFHSVALVYLPLVIIDNIKINKKIYILLFVYVISAMVLLKSIVSNSDIIGRFIQLFSNNEEVIMYGVTQINYGFLVPLGYFAFNIGLVLISKKILMYIGKFKENKRLINICISTLVLSSIFVPFLVVNLTFDRIFRNFSFLYYILAGIVIQELAKKEKTLKNKQLIFLYISFLILFSTVWTVGSIYRYNGFGDTEYGYILNNNMFF